MQYMRADSGENPADMGTGSDLVEPARQQLSFIPNHPTTAIPRPEACEPQSDKVVSFKKRQLSHF